MIRRRPLRFLAHWALLLALGFPAAAWAGPKLAVTRIDGDTDEEVRDAVIEALQEGDFTLAKKKDVNKAADKAGDLAELTATSAKKLAKTLTADVIVVGTVVKDGAKKKFRVKLYKNGESKKFTLSFRKATSNSFKRTVREQVVEKLDGAGEAVAEDEPKKGRDTKDPKKGAKAEPDEEEPIASAKATKKGGRDPKKGAKEDAEPAVAKTTKKGAKEDAEPAKASKSEKVAKSEKSEASDEEESKSSDEEDALRTKKDKDVADATPDEGGDSGDEPAVSKRAEAAPSGRAMNRAAVRVNIGPSVLTRTLRFKSNLEGMQKPRDVKVSPVAGGRIEAELYPLGLGNPDSTLAGLGIGVDADYTASIKVGGEKATQFSFMGGLRFRLVGRSSTSPSVTLALDGGLAKFQTGVDDMVPADYLPDILYKFLAPGLAARYPLGERIALFADGKAQIIIDAGDIVSAKSYGKAKVFGIDAQAGFEVLFGRRIAVRLSGDFTQIGFAFQGKGGDQANNRDGDPSDIDVTGATDRAIGGALTLAVGY